MILNKIAAAVAVLAVALPAWADDPLDGISIQPELDVPYDRDDYKHWVDEDGDGQDARQEALIAESLIKVSLSDRGAVREGLWVGPYTGRVIRNSRIIDIDHRVALGEAHVSGAANWTPERKEAYANDLADEHHLIGVWRSANRSKSDKDPAEWMPPNRSYWCSYLNEWIAVKRKWKLSMDEKEAAAIREGLNVCARYVKRDAIGGLN